MDIQITLTIPEAKIPAAKQGYFKLYPNSETKDDPAWVDPGDGSTTPQVPKYTDTQWFKKCLRRMVVRDIRRGLQMLQNEQGQVSIDDGIVI